MNTAVPTGRVLLLFDGYCHLCNWSVRFVLRFDRKKKFLFSPLSGETGIFYKRRFQIFDELDSIIVIENDSYLAKSEAIFAILKKLGGLFYFLLIFKVIPKSTRDHLYDWIAKKRYRWFGRRESCLLPNPEQKNQFI